MRPLLCVVLFASACTPVDTFLGTYAVTVSGTDMQTAPSASTQNVTGTGTLAITADKTREGYLLTFGQVNYLCSLKAKRSTATPTELEIADMQTCVLPNNFTAVTTSGSVTMDKDTMTTATLTVAYTYSGQLVFNVAGTGTRTFAGPRQ